jgi:hypothetical protein
MDISGRVILEGAIKPAMSGKRLFLTAEGRSGRIAELTADGTFAAPGLLPGKYRIDVWGFPKEFYVKSITAGDADVLNSGLIVGVEGTAALAVVVASDGGRVKGVVLDKDEQPVSGATVLLRSRIAMHVTTDQYGNYEFSSVPPGNYKLFAWDDVEPNGWNDTEFMKDFEARGRDVTVLADSSQTEKLHVLN